MGGWGSAKRRDLLLRWKVEWGLTRQSEEKILLGRGRSICRDTASGETWSIERPQGRSEWPGYWKSVEGAYKEAWKGEGVSFLQASGYVRICVLCSPRNVRPKKCFKGTTWCDLNLWLHLTTIYQVPAVF